MSTLFQYKLDVKNPLIDGLR